MKGGQPMSAQIVEGSWEEVITRTDLRGHRVRVIVMDSAPTETPTGSDWLKHLREWVDSRPAVTHFVDDSRESIYDGTVNDPR
jgi:hypothetical protein